MKKVIIASGNEGKVFEIKNIFSDLNLELLSLKDLEAVPEIIEDGDSFEANARIKARAIFQKYEIPAIGDDSGLSVDQLDGRPGIFSARYSGENATYADNNIKLLKELGNLPEPHPAKFICSAVFFDGARDICRTGEIKGQITKTPRGWNGFGYDPVFIPEGYNLTFSELSTEVKNKISHRAKAFLGMREVLKKL